MFVVTRLWTITLLAVAATAAALPLSSKSTDDNHRPQCETSLAARYDIVSQLRFAAQNFFILVESFEIFQEKNNVKIFEPG